MKIAVTSQGDRLDSPVDPRFGRAKFFALADTESGQVQFVDNEVNLNAAQGAGIQAARRIVELGAGALVTGNVGPKAFTVLQSGGVAIFIGASGNIEQAIAQYKSGMLKQASDANVEGHWV